MQNIRVALIQTRWPGTRQIMQAVYHQKIAEAAAKGAQLVCLQEFTLSPYFASTLDPAGFDWAEPLEGGPTHDFLGKLAQKHGLFIIGSIFEREGEKYWDTATIYNPQGNLHGFTRKVHIPQGEGYHENHFFAGSDRYPIHDVLGVKIAIPTCYDQWFPEMSRICALNGAKFIFYPTAIGSEPTNPGVDTKDSWQTVMRGQAIASGVFIAAANRVGLEGVTFYGSSFICEPNGTIIIQASRDRDELLVTDLDPAALQEWRRLFPLLQQRRPSAYGRISAA
ncbi:MAG: hydrolase [Chloroflexi bacterium HGW-Chloroflexi-6]|nr:MAG: hydrolase [Chloroflexi bacterium HGW-Chloroflexi-6]